MKFYTDRLNEFRQMENEGVDLETRLHAAKQVVDQNYEDHAANLANAYYALRRAGRYEGDDVDSLYENVRSAQEQFNYVVAQSPKQFFAGVANLEENGLLVNIYHAQNDRDADHRLHTDKRSCQSAVENFR